MEATWAPDDRIAKVRVLPNVSILGSDRGLDFEKRTREERIDGHVKLVMECIVQHARSVEKNFLEHSRGTGQDTAKT